MEHPQTNGQVEAANKVILGGLRKRLDNAKGRWAEELPSVLWAYHTNPQSSTLETPFSLMFGAEALIPVEVGEPTIRRMTDAQNIEQARLAELDLIQVSRELAHIQEVAAKQRAAKKYNILILQRAFRVGDLVLRKEEPARKPATEGKLAANWEGPYKVIQELGKGAYHLSDHNGKPLPRSWNAASLKRYFS